MSKQTYLMVPEGQEFLSNKQKWQKNYISFAGYLAGKYQGGFRDAWDLIVMRYVRMKGVVWPDEFKAFYLLFAHKHPEFMGSTRIKNDRSEYGWSGCYWDYKFRRHRVLFGYRGIFNCEPISPKPEKRDKLFLDLVGNEMFSMKKGYVTNRVHLCSGLNQLNIFFIIPLNINIPWINIAVSLQCFPARM